VTDRQRVRWLRRALENLEAEARHVARDSPSGSERLVATIAEAVERLADFPSSGRSGRVEGTRELVVPGTLYLLPYRFHRGAVEILRVFHTSRKWPDEM